MKTIVNHPQIILVISTVWALLLTPSYSHMTVDPPMAAPGSSATFYLKISHDCGDATTGTSNFTIVPPMGMLNVKAEKIGDWRVEFDVKELNPPVKRGERTYNDRVIRISYLGFLPDRMWKKFGVSGIMPEEEGMVYFKGYQDCYGEDTDLRWEMIPTDENPEPRYPAAGVNITKEAEEDHA